ncbi:MAG: hypothetical protein WCJ80_11930 [Bacteroidota bacterium]
MKTTLSQTRMLSVMVVALIMITMSACRVTMLPPRDAAIVAQIDAVSKSVDLLYLTMLESDSVDNRTYATYAERYINIEVELTSLLNKNKVRPLNKNSTRICEISLQLWQKYKEEHKLKRLLNNDVVKLYRVRMSNLFYTMQVAEKGKEEQ